MCQNVTWNPGAKSWTRLVFNPLSCWSRGNRQGQFARLYFTSDMFFFPSRFLPHLFHLPVPLPHALILFHPQTQSFAGVRQAAPPPAVHTRRDDRSAFHRAALSLLPRLYCAVEAPEIFGLISRPLPFFKKEKHTPSSISDLWLRAAGAICYRKCVNIDGNWEVGLLPDARAARFSQSREEMNSSAFVRFRLEKKNPKPWCQLCSHWDQSLFPFYRLEKNHHWMWWCQLEDTLVCAHLTTTPTWASYEVSSVV